MSTESKSAGVKRRTFLKVLGATGAATTMVGCDTDGVQKLIPYLVNPDNTVPGVSTYYATTCRECASACGVLAETRDGRAFKLEGNPEHPLNRGALCSRGQAAVQGLYNPDRYRTPMIREGGALKPTTWDKALQTLAQKLGEARSRGGAGNAVFVNQHEGGSFPAFLDQWLADMGMPAHLSWDAEADHQSVAAHREAYGTAWPTFDFDAARLVVSFSADFLDGWGMTVPQQLAWADARAKLEGAPRFVYVGPRRSLTGLNADEWVACRPGTELAIANFLAGQGSAEEAAQAAGVKAEQLTRLQAELRATTPSLLLAGSTASNGTELGVAVARLNQSLGNVGRTVRPNEPVGNFDRVASTGELLAAVDRMNAGQVPVFMVRGANPAYALPKGAGFVAALAKVPFKVSFSSFPDETSELCDLVLPDHHALEAWGDAPAGAGRIALQQPTMDPVFDTRQTADVLIDLAKRDPNAAGRYAAVANYRAWLAGRFPGGANAFAGALRTGLAQGAVLARAGGAAPAAPAANRVAQPVTGMQNGEFYVLVYPSPVLGAGSGANKPWLQELADPVTKIAWQSWVEIHPLTARRLGVNRGDHVTVKTAAGQITAPAYHYLGVREDVVAIALGRGHTAYGRYAKNIGVNALDVVPATVDARSNGLVLAAAKGSVAKAEGHSDLVTTEGSARQHGRGVAQAVLATELNELRPRSWRGEPMQPGEDALGAGRGSTTRVEQGDTLTGKNTSGPQPHAGGETAKGDGHGAAAEGKHGVAPVVGPFGGPHGIAGNPDQRFEKGLKSPVAADAQGELVDPTAKSMGMYDEDHWSGMAKRRWAMTIDLARCTGCSACVTACYAENNIPTVGAPYQGRQLGPLPGMWDETPGANILKGREMTWIRLERYFEGGEDGSTDFETRFLPMLCQHCGNAPCEPVCPVYATYHSPDGLNVQVYNRCVGTRYCSNNCPYKVRYFNWFGYGEPARRQYAWPEPLHWQLNPDVTVRGKGVMEKCTFCVQRIREAENRAALEHRGLKADEFTVACAQACPSRAITFGDAADDSWSIARLVEDKRAYHVFEELNTYTAVVYLKKVNHLGEGQKNPAPAAAEH